MPIKARISVDFRGGINEDWSDGRLAVRGARFGLSEHQEKKGVSNETVGNHLLLVAEKHNSPHLTHRKTKYQNTGWL